MEMTFAIFFNLRYGTCNFKVIGSWVNYIYAVIFAAAIVIMPFFILIFYCKNFHKLKDKEFKFTYGSVYEGLKVGNRSAIFYTTYFLTRRCIFTFVSLFLYMYPIIQLALIIVVTLGACCYVLHYKPFKENLINRLEAMNEVFTVFLMILMFFFTDVTESKNTQYMIGYMFVAGLVLCICVHLFYLFKDILHQLIIYIKKRKANRETNLLR